KPTSSSSATIWATATSSPCPMSILPKKACTRPFGSTAIQESSSPGTSGGLPDCASASIAGAEIDTTRAPEVFRNSQRSMIVSSDHFVLRALDGAHDRHMRPAAALEARERVAHLRVARLRVLLQRRGRGHHPAVAAVAAL